MPAFDPDAYLAATAPKSFDPDAYLAATAPKNDQNKGIFQRAKDWTTKPLLKPQEVANFENAPATALSMGLMKPPDLSEIQNSPEKNQAEPWSQGARGVLKEMYNLSSGMSAPLNLGMLGLGVVAPGAGMAVAAPQIPGMFKGAYEGLKGGKEARESGNYEQAGEKYTSGVSNLLMALGLAKGLGNTVKEAVSPSDPYSKAKSPEIQEIAKSGYPLNPAEITGRSIPNFMRGMFRRNPIANQKMQDFGLEQEAALNEDVGNFKEGIGEAPPSEEMAAKVGGVLPKETYTQGVKGLKSQFAEQEAARLAQHAAGADAVKQQFTDQEYARENAYDAARGQAEAGLKALPQSDANTAGAALDAGVKGAYAELNKNYSEQTRPLVKEHLNKKASPQKLRDGINDILDQNDLIDEKGNILRDDIKTVVSPEQRAFLGQLADISESLQTNPTIKKLSRVTQDLQRLANFDGIERTPEQKMFGKLSHSSKEALLDSLEPHVGPEAFKALQAAKAAYSATRPVIDELSSATANKYGSQIVGGAKTALPPELLGAAAEKVPQLKGPLGDVVVNNIIQKASGPEALTKMIDSYGRENLQNILGPEKFQALTDAEAAYGKAGQPFEKAQAPQPIPFERAIPPEPIPQTAKSQLSEELGGIAEENPNGIADAVIKPENVQRIRMAREILGDQFDAVKQQFTQKLLGKPKIQKGQTEGSIAGAGLKTRLGKYGNEVLSEIYSPEELAQLNTLANKANISESAISARSKPPMRGAAGPLAMVKKLVESVVEPPIVEAFLNPTVTRIASTKLPVPKMAGLAASVSNAANHPPKNDTWEEIQNYLANPPTGGKNAGLFKVDPELAKIVEGVPDVAGYQPTITSGYRSQAEQDALKVPGKAPISLHTSGEAVDQRIKDLSPDQIKKTLLYYNSIPGFRAFIDNGNHIHVERRT